MALYPQNAPMPVKPFAGGNQLGPIRIIRSFAHAPNVYVKFASEEALNPLRSIDSSAEHKLNVYCICAKPYGTLMPSTRVSAEHP